MNILPVWNEEYDAFKTEVRKCVLSWLSDGDIDEIIYLTYLHLPGRPEAKDGLLTLSLSASLLDTLADQILDQLTFQRDYWFDFPLPQIDITDDIELSSTVVLVRNTIKEQQGLFGPVVAPGGGAMLRVRGRGYVYGSRSQSAYLDALRKVKWTLQIATLENYLIRVPRRKSALALAIGGNEQQEIYQAKWISDLPRSSDFCRVDLSSGLSKYLSEITFANGAWKAQQAESLQYYVGNLLNTVQDPIAEKNVTSIRRSLEWAFDARIDEDEHMRFIKTCIGLEAAISEQSEEIGITEQLADRCAFLLDKTSTARVETRTLMRKVYQLRSKLVHGVAAGLSEPERNLARQAEKILTSVLRTELKAIMDWYNTLKQ